MTFLNILKLWQKPKERRKEGVHPFPLYHGGGGGGVRAGGAGGSMSLLIRPRVNLKPSFH